MAIETHKQYQAAEVTWYRRHGRNLGRISRDSAGDEYVIGDDGWNRNGRPREHIETQMAADLYLRMGLTKELQ